MVDVTRIAVAVDGKQIKSAKNELNLMQKAGERAQKSVTSLGASIAALSVASFGAFAAVRVIADFDTSLRGLQAVSGATADQMERLEDQARELGATTAFSASQAADAQRFLAMAGLEVNEVLGATPGILQLAIAGQLDLARAADLASNVLGGFNLEVEELGRVNDVLASTAASSNTSIEQLGSALSFAAPIAAAAGVSIEETAAAIGALGDAGLQGTRAGTGFLGIIRQLSNVTPKAEEALSKYGISVADVDVETRGLTAVLRTLGEANLSAADAIQIFGSEAGPAGNILASSAERVAEFTEELGDAEGAASRMAEIMGEGLAMAFREFQSAAEEAVLVVGRDLGAGGQLESAVRTATEGVRLLSENMDTLADVATGVSVVLAGRLAASSTASAIAFATMATSGSTSIVALRTLATVAPITAAKLAATTVATRGLSLVLSALGGPVGIVFTVGAALFAFREELGLVDKSLEDVEAEVDKLTRSLEKMTKAQAESRLLDVQEDYEDAKDAMSDAAEELQRLTELQALARTEFARENLSEKIIKQKAALDTARQSVEKYEGAIKELTEFIERPAISALDAYTQYANSFKSAVKDDIEEPVKSASEAISVLTDEGYRLQDAYLQLVASMDGSGSLTIGGAGADEVVDKYRQKISDLNFEIGLLAGGYSEAEMQAMRFLRQDGVSGSVDELADAFRRLAAAQAEADRTTSVLTESGKDLRDAYSQLAASMEGSGALTIGGAGATEVVDQYKEKLAELNFELELLAGNYTEAEKEAMRFVRNNDMVGNVDELASAYQRLSDAQRDSTSELARFVEEANDNFANFNSAAVNALQSSEDAFVELAMTGKFEMRDMIDSIISDIIRLQIRQQITAPIAAGLSGFASSLGGGNIFGSLFGSIFGGGRASGGPVSAGTMYEVNENGPELLNYGSRQYLMMGSQGGSITPNHMLGGGAANVNVSVVNNGQPLQVTSQSQSTGSDGSVNLELVVDEMVASNLKSRTSKSNRAVRRGFGVDQPLAIR